MMMKRLIPFLLLLLNMTLHAQRPESVITHGDLGEPSTDESRMMCNDAGTITFGPATHTGFSTDIGTPVYLCFGDQLLIDHDENTESLVGDPNPTTPGGIGYAFYECQPSVMGDNLAAIKNDNCLYQNPFFTDENGVILATISMDSIWMATGAPNPDGDILFVNDGSLQAGFNNNEPVSFWFAPITYDALAVSQPVYEGSPAGSCVNVNTAEAFEVVYLNEIEVTNINSNAGVNGCQGAFRIRGGLPEYDNSDYVSIDIHLQGDPTIVGDIESGPATHNENVVFRAPRPGMYDITITDGKGCPLTFSMDMSSCTGVGINAVSAVGQPGMHICLPITVTDFDSIQTFQFSMNWDPDIVQFDSISMINTELTNNGGLETGDMNVAVNDGILTLNWLINNFNIPGVFIPDGGTLFELCYTLIGEDGECSGINFSNSPTTFEASTINDVVLGMIPTNGLLCISDNPVAANVVPDSTSCNGSSDGGFTVTVLGENPPFRFQWESEDGALGGLLTFDQDGDNQMVQGLPAGLYIYTVTDASTPQSMDMGTFVIDEPGVLGANISFTAPLCFGDSTAVITANVLVNNVTVANTDGYTFNWAPAANTRVLTDRPAGLYSVTITDPNGCTVQDSESVPDPAPITCSITVTNATCSGSEDGRISVMPSGGTAANGTYHFDWCGLIPPGNFGSQTINNLNPGRYCLVITDDNGCSKRDTIMVGADKLLVATVANYTPPSCNGVADGTLTIVSSTSGTPPAGAWTYNWSTSNNANYPSMDNGNMSTVSDLGNGTIRLIMTDSDPAGCELDTTFMITEPELLVVDSVQTRSVTCIGGGNDGEVTIFASGGTGAYTYTNVTDNGVPQNSSTIAGLVPGIYDIEVVDANNCSTMVEVTIGSPTPPIVNIETDSLDCANDVDGTLTAMITPGSAVVQSIMWDNGSTNAMLTGLTPGQYIITVTAEDACVTIDTGFVVAPLPLMTDSLLGISPDCPGLMNGSATIFASGGTMPYTYAWETGGASALLPSLGAGDYTVTVTDANGCAPLIETVTVEPADSILLEFLAIDSVTCNGGVPCDGAATVMASMSDGSNQLFNIMWESGESSSAVTEHRALMLCQGWQTVTVTDMEICSVVDSVLIPSPEVLKIDPGQTFSVPVTCNGDTNGSASVAAIGGTAPYNYLWDFDGSTGQMISNVPPGEQSVVITDANGCTFTHTIEVGEPDPFVLTLDTDPNNTRNVECNGESNGIITVIPTGGNALGNMPYTWMPPLGNPASPTAEGLPAGTYTVIAEDILGCSDTLSHTITEPTPLLASIPPVPQPECFGFQTFVTVDDITGGNGPLYTFSIGVEQIVGEAIPIFVNGLTDEVTITLRDAMGCESDTTITVTQPQEVQVILPDLLEVQLGDSIRLNPTLVHDLPLELILWTPNTALSDDMIANPSIRPIESLEYTLTITDINGCVGSDDVFIDVDKNRNVYIPNAFTPNGDGFNDLFNVYTGPGVKAINSMKIFDRWGELVYSAGDDAPLTPNPNGVGRWDGEMNGKVVNQGVYVYLIEVLFEDEVKLLYRGDITVMQ